MNLAGKKVLIIQQRNWGINIGHALAKRLQAAGVELGAMTVKQSTHDFVMRQGEVEYKTVAFVDAPKNDPAGFLAGRDISLDRICRELGIGSVWPYVQSLRNHVKCYKDKYYYGFKQNVSDEEIVRYVKAVYLFIQDLYDEFPFDAVLTPNYAGIYHLFLERMAEKKGIPIIGISDTKVRGHYYFSYSPNEDRERLLDRYRALNEGTVSSPRVEDAREYVANMRKNFVVPDYMEKGGEQVSFPRKCFREMLPFYWALRAFLKRGADPADNLGPTYDNKTPYLHLRDHFAHKRNTHVALNFPYADYDAIGPFAFFPLQFQPEATLDVQSVRVNNQIETARQVAMSLPGDMTLVVKDHPAMLGRRPASYLEKVARTPNVKLVDFRLPSERLLKDARLVVAPGGTILAEAAYLKMPAIQLGDLGKTGALPNVIRVTDFSRLSDAIGDGLNIDTESAEYERRLANYVAAVYDVGFELDYVEIWEGRSAEGLDAFVGLFVDELTMALEGRG